MKDLKVILIVFLLGVSALSAFKFVSTLKEKNLLRDQLEKTKLQVTALEDEKQNLLQSLEKEKKLNQDISDKNVLLKGNLKAGAKKINVLFSRLDQADKDLSELKSRVFSLKAENDALKLEREKLKFDLSQFEQRFSSIPELKKAVEALKHPKKKVTVEIKKKLNNPQEEAIIEGNRGFLLKNGKPVPILKVKIEVNPALPKNEVK